MSEKSPDQWEAAAHIDAMQKILDRPAVKSNRYCPEHALMMEDRKTETRANMWVIRRLDLNGNGKGKGNGEVVCAEILGMKLKGKGAVVTKALMVLIEKLALYGGLAWLVIHKGG